MPNGATKEVIDYKLSRYACYLIVQNASPARHKSVTLGQTYFAVQTRKMELTQEEYLSKFKIPSTKPVHAYDEKLNFLGKYESVAEASKYFDNSKSAISRSCQRKNKALTNGYSFRFFYEDEIAKQNIDYTTQTI